MKKWILTIAMLASVGSTAFATPGGFLFTNVQEPVTGTQVQANCKTASGSNMSILGLVGFGDAGAKTIADRAGITKIHHIDKATSSFLFLFQNETFTVYGE